MASLQPVQVLQYGAEEERAETARLSAFVGAIAIGDLIKSTLGPKGMDKVLMSMSPHNEGVQVSNDGATILKSIGVDNPAAKVLVDISLVQDDEVGDGTTSVTVLACELLKEAEQLIAAKIHPQTIIAGWRKASDCARQALADSASDNSADPEKFKEDLMNIARTTLSSKLLTHHKDHFSGLAVEAVLRLKGSGNLEAIKVIKKLGGKLAWSYLEEGFLLEKRVGVNQPKRLENARILIANTSMDTDKIKVFGSKVRVDSTAKIAELELAEKDCTLKRNELTAIRTQTEREANEKRKLEDTVMEKMMQRLTMDKATQYTRKSVEKLRRRAEELDITVANVDNEISVTRLQISQVTSELKYLQQVLDKQAVTMQKQNQLISHSESEITHSNALVERKQTQIDQLNKKIDQKLSKMEGGKDLGPLELKIDALQNQISESLEQCAQMQQFWLRQQNDLVHKTRQTDEQAQAVDSLKKQLLILNQKKLRTDAQLEREERERTRVGHGISSLQKDMTRLNTLITEKRGQKERMQQDTVLVESDFVRKLKELELESIQLGAKMEQLQEEKERLLNSTLEAEHQIMLWEKKIQVAKEMREAVDSDIGQPQITAMKAEIHRMQVRHDQLMRQQEKLIQDMEKAVYRRETIVLRGDAQAKSGKKDQTQGHLRKKVADMQRQIKQTAKDTSKCEEQARELQQDQNDISTRLEEEKVTCQQLRETLEEVTEKVLSSEEAKKMGMTELLSSQSRVKYLTAAKEGRYRMLTRTAEAREAELHRQTEKLQSLQAIVEKLEGDFPSCHAPLRPIALSLRARLVETQTLPVSREIEVA